MANPGAHYHLPPLSAFGGPQTTMLPPIHTVLQSFAPPPLSSGQGPWTQLAPLGTANLHTASLQFAQPRPRRLPGNRPSLRWSHAQYTNTAPPAEELQDTENSAMKITRVYDLNAFSELLAATGTGPVQPSQQSQQHQTLYAETSLSVATQTEIHYEFDESGELDIERDKLSPCLDIAARWREAAPEETRPGVLSSTNPPRWRPSQDTQTRQLAKSSETLMDMELPNTRVKLTEADLAAPSERYRLYDASGELPAEQDVVEVEMVAPQPESVFVPSDGPAARAPDAIRALMRLDFLC